MRIDDIDRELEDRCDFFGEPGNKLPLVEITGGEPMLQKRPSARAACAMRG